MQGTPANFLQVQIIAMDGGVPMMETSHSLMLLLDDINEFSPKFEQPSYEESTQNTAPPNSYIIQVTATDRDGRDNVISYDIVPDTTSGSFTIDMNGVIRNTRFLDRLVSHIHFSDSPKLDFVYYKNCCISCTLCIYRSTLLLLLLRIMECQRP